MNIKKKAFTLIELLVVIAIVGILTGFIAVQMDGAANAARDSRKKATVDAIKKSLIMDKVETGSYPIEASCTIGSDCDDLDPIIEEYIPNDLDGVYTYESEGNGCTISTILSTGYSYQYDCLTASYSNNQPINGACGASEGANLSSLPVDNLCNQGAASAVGGAGPWSWTCAGSFGGTNDSCLTGNVPLNGVCGLAHNSNFYSTPSTDLCDQGTPSAVSGNGPWTWECAGSYTGSSPICAANKSTDGDCGSSHGANLSSIPSTNLCNQGTPSAVGGAGPWNWTCAGTNGGVTDNCTTGGVPLNGACGISNGGNFSSAPTVNLCNQGNPSVVLGSGPWTWDCNGINTGTNISCGANKIINGVCGTANKAYAYNVITYVPDTLCATGIANPASPEFPPQGSSRNWTCTGVNGGTTSGTCTASRASAPLVNAVHTELQCTTAGGMVFVSDVAANQCLFSGASCPSLWTQYKSYSTTMSRSCGVSHLECGGTCWCTDTPCTTANHAWSNNASLETCTWTQVYMTNCMSCQGSGSASQTCTATRTQIGCY